MEPEVHHDIATKRFYLISEGYAVQLDYSLDEEVISLYHVYSPPPIREKGLAKKVVRFALDYAKENKLKVIPACTFVQSFISNNEQYRNLLA